MHRIVLVFTVTAALVLMVFAGARWYADQAALPDIAPTSPAALPGWAAF